MVGHDADMSQNRSMRKVSGWMTGVSSAPSHNFQTGCGAHSVSYAIGIIYKPAGA